MKLYIMANTKRQNYSLVINYSYALLIHFFFLYPKEQLHFLKIPESLLLGLSIQEKQKHMFT